jgi:prepilin-type N-terminal cleavage/methylation domain-containing protein
VRSRINFTDKNLIERGFTLVELLVVIVILGILAAVVVFAVGGITNKGKTSACTIEVRTINTALQANYANTGTYPAAGVPPTVVQPMLDALKTAKLLSTATNSSSTTGASYDGAGNYTATC